MSKAILEIEMPDSCAKCPCSYISARGERYCTVAKLPYLSKGYEKKRRHDCPLVKAEGEGK
jgi:hypothetical protein